MDQPDTPAHRLHEGIGRRAWADFASQARGAVRRPLVTGAAYTVLFGAFFTWMADGFSWLDVGRAGIAALGALVAFEAVILLALVAATPLRQRAEARREASRLRDIEQVADERRDDLAKALEQRVEVERECARLAPFEAKADSLSTELVETKRNLGTASRDLAASRDEVARLTERVEVLERDNAILEDAASGAQPVVHRTHDTSLGTHGLRRFQHDVRQAVPQAALRFTEDVLTEVSGTPGSPLLTLHLKREEDARWQRVLVDALIPYGIKLPLHVQRAAGRVRSHQVHGALVLVDELNEVVTAKFRRELDGLPRVELIAWSRDTAPYKDRLDAALERLMALPERSEEDDAAIKNWIEGRRTPQAAG